jgi:GGDEF domain-containing protein
LTERAFAHLRHVTGMRTWVLSRVVGDRWTVLVVDDEYYGLQAGSSFAWSDTLCRPMVESDAPSIARDVAHDDRYRSAAIRQQYEIGAYVGYAVRDADGGLFGTVCAFDPDPQSADLDGHGSSIALVVEMMTAQLRTELRLIDEVRRADAALALTWADPVTHLINDRGLAQLLEREEARCQRYGSAASLVAVTLTAAAGPDSARAIATAQVLLDCCRTTDVAARTGAGDFVVFLAEADAQGATVVAQRIAHDLHQLGIDGRVTVGSRPPRSTLGEALEAAERGYPAIRAVPAPSHLPS